MLDHLHIQNYRLFKDLKIDKLGQVNLIAGKNNTGKTALLEALRIWASEGDKFVISSILKSRGDFVVGHLSECKNLFLGFNLQNAISISVINSGRVFKLGCSTELSINLLNVEKFIVHRNIDNFFIYDFPFIKDDYIFDKGLIYLPFLTPTEFLSKYWGRISLTPSKIDVIGILKIIEPKIRDLSIDLEEAKVILEGTSNPISLKNLGDGINRILSIALALVNTRSSIHNILIIDEFEVGLHHSVQKQLWEIIFKYAKDWNIQVFVTTHSQDTIENFYYVANRKENEEMGNYFILSRDKDDIKAINYDFSEMKLALETNLELR